MLYDECHAKIDLFKVKKIVNFSLFKIVSTLFYSKYSHLFDIKITRNSTIFHEIIPIYMPAFPPW